MKEEKFRRRADMAWDDSKKARKLFRDLLRESPSDERDDRLRELETCLDSSSIEEMLEDVRTKACKKEVRRRYSRLTGYGQCRGNLRTLDNIVVECCCEEMAANVAVGRVLFNGRSIILAPEAMPPSEAEGGTYYVRGRIETLRRCPYCLARISEIEPEPAESQRTPRAPSHVIYPSTADDGAEREPRSRRRRNEESEDDLRDLQGGGRPRMRLRLHERPVAGHRPQLHVREGEGRGVRLHSEADRRIGQRRLPQEAPAHRHGGHTRRAG